MSFENPQNAKPLSSEEEHSQEFEEFREMSEKAQEKMRVDQDAKNRTNMPKAEAEKKMDKSYYENRRVNGVTIIVGWDDDKNMYGITFPQIETGDVAREKGVDDDNILISQDKEKAKDALNFAIEYAKLDEMIGQKTDVYGLYKKVERFRPRDEK